MSHRIVLTSHLFLPDHAAGTEILTFETAKELSRRGWSVEIVTGAIGLHVYNDMDRFDTYLYDGITVNRFKYSPAPMGKQSSIGELEYNNELFGEWFKGYLHKFRPDIVHFFHLGVISASAIDACHVLRIPCVMTPTDFWLLCPNCQLRLPDDSTCRGPDRESINCIKHAAISVLPTTVGAAFNLIPDQALSILVNKITSSSIATPKIFTKVRALRKRNPFLQQRMNLLDRMIAPTRIMADILAENGLDRSRLVYSRFGIRRTANPPRKENSAGTLRIGFIGGLARHKGAHVLVGAIKALPDLCSIEVRIYGDQSFDTRYFDGLVSLAANDPRISFCGTFPNESIGEIFAELDVLVVPSIWYENTPLVIYSAQEAGCPVIASNLGGMSEVIKHEKSGLLFEAGDFVGLASAIERLAQDRALLSRLSRNAEKPKSISDYVSELLTIYGEVLSERGVRS